MRNMSLALLHPGHRPVTFACLHCGQVNLMRFSSLFQTPLPQHPAAQAEPAGEAQPPASLPAPELPDDLDARVRMVGEWQLLEG